MKFLYSKLNSASWWFPLCWNLTHPRFSFLETLMTNNPFPHDSFEGIWREHPCSTSLPSKWFTARLSFTHSDFIFLQIGVGLIFHKIITFIMRSCHSVSDWRIGPTEVHLPCALKPLTTQAKAELSRTPQGGQVLKCSVLRWASSFTLPLVASPTLSLAPYLPHLSSSFPHPIPTVELSYPTSLNL